MDKYLYGAAVQGIQSFIFQTNKLQEIVGASELVEEICTSFFRTQVGEKKFKKENLILGAAGNIKYIFECQDECKEFVRKFPKEVMEMAPGITISQAVVKYGDGESKLNDALQDLEDKLRIQRNKVSIPFEVSFMGTKRAKRTGGVAFKQSTFNEGKFIDEATFKKLEKQESHSLFKKISGLNDFKTEDLLFNLDHLKGSWMAVVHADGNGIGAILQNLHISLQNKTYEEVKNAFKQFSNALEVSTKKAAQEAFEKTIQKEKGQAYPIRPIVLGGDDLTIIIQADLALKFTHNFLKQFESETKTNFSFLKEDFQIQGFENGITACAGIAYVKKTYPFHYAVDLAEKLCGDAKNFVKGKTNEYKDHHPKMNGNGLVPKSALAFFKVQDSYIESSLSAMKQRVAKAKDYNFNYGPYLIDAENKDFANIDELLCKLKVVDQYGYKPEQGESNGISKLRQWITEVYKDKTTADFFLDRMKKVNFDFYEQMELEKERAKKKSIIYDVVLLNSLKN